MTISIYATKKSKKFFNTLEEKLYSIHGDKYSFDESIYINSKTRIKVICKEHGEFYPLVTNLLRNHGCKKCGTERQSLSASFSTLDFIKKAKKVHGDKYIYDKAYTKEEKLEIEKMFYTLFAKFVSDLETNNTNSIIYTSYLNNMHESYHHNTNERIVLDYIAGKTDDYFNLHYDLINKEM